MLYYLCMRYVYDYKDYGKGALRTYVRTALKVTTFNYAMLGKYV